MSMLILIAAVAAFELQAVVGTTECYSCVDATAVSNCSSAVSCTEGEVCFADHKTTATGQLISLGCRPEVSCSSVLSGSSGNVSMGGSLIGRSTASGLCSECCRQSRCNKQLCQSSSQQHCSDGGSLNCGSIAEIFDICRDHDHALQACRRFCGLCSYADGSWSAWLQWSNCDGSCGNGSQSRTRTCTDPSPSGGGKNCIGTSIQTQICFDGPCPVHGNWGQWSLWGGCSASCGIGLQRRDRSCSNPYPSLHGNHCFGDSRDDKICMESACPETDGGWSVWSVWGECSATCDTGLKTRQRKCNNPVPSSGGQYCEGSVENVVLCNQRPCQQTNGGWSDWSDWTACSATCDAGLKTRERKCSNPVPSSGGQYCEGSSMDIIQCNNEHCPRTKSSFTAKDAVTMPSGILSFANVLLNEGLNFKGNTGTFSCQHSGLYVFSANIVEHGSSRNDVDCYIRNNDNPTVPIIYRKPLGYNGYQTVGGRGAATGTATLHLTTGDRVHVWCNPQTSETFYSSFTGLLVAEDP